MRVAIGTRIFRFESNLSEALLCPAVAIAATYRRCGSLSIAKRKGTGSLTEHGAFFTIGGRPICNNDTRNRFYMHTGRPTPRPRRCGGPEHHGVHLSHGETYSCSAF